MGSINVDQPLSAYNQTIKTENHMQHRDKIKYFIFNSNIIKHCWKSDIY